MNQKIMERLKDGRWTVETARRFRILCRNWILERGPGPIAAALMIVQPVAYSQEPYRPKGWVWHDSQDGIGSPGLNAKDKRQHLCAGILAGSYGALLAEHWGSKHPWIWGLVTGLAIGYLKEVYDLRKGSGTAEHADALWTATGGAIGAVIVKVRW